MFEVRCYAEAAECLNCDKATECLVVACTRGTFAGPLCTKCLVREAKKRAKTGRPADPPKEATP